MRSRRDVVLGDVGHALLCGVGVGAGVFGSVMLLAVFRVWAWWWPVVAGVVAGSVSFAFGAVAFTLDSRSLLWRLEEGLGVDVDGDEWVGEPLHGEEVFHGRRRPPADEPERSLIYVRNVKAEQKRRRARDFRAFLQGAYNGRGTTWRSWKGAELPSGERVSRSTWEAYTERLERAGLGERPYETASLELTSSYRDALETFAEVL